MRQVKEEYGCIVNTVQWLEPSWRSRKASFRGTGKNVSDFITAGKKSKFFSSLFHSHPTVATLSLFVLHPRLRTQGGGEKRSETHVLNLRISQTSLLNEDRILHGRETNHMIMNWGGSFSTPFKKKEQQKKGIMKKERAWFPFSFLSRLHLLRVASFCVLERKSCSWKIVLLRFQGGK